MNLYEHLVEIHGEENIIAYAGGVSVKQGCDCERCST